MHDALCVLSFAWWQRRVVDMCSETCLHTKSGCQLSAESNLTIALVLYFYALWLAKKISRYFLIQSEVKPKQSWLASMRFPALCAGYMCLLRVLIGSFDCVCLLWLVRMITLVLVLRHSNENRSNIQQAESWHVKIETEMASLWSFLQWLTVTKLSGHFLLIIAWLSA